MGAGNTDDDGPVVDLYSRFFAGSPGLDTRHHDNGSDGLDGSDGGGGLQAELDAFYGDLDAYVRSHRMTIREVFARFDADGDRVLTRDELRGLVEETTRGTPPGTRSMSERLHLAVQSRARLGDDGSLAYEDFTAFLRSFVPSHHGNGAAYPGGGAGLPSIPNTTVRPAHPGGPFRLDVPGRQHPVVPRAGRSGMTDDEPAALPGTNANSHVHVQAATSPRRGPPSSQRPEVLTSVAPGSERRVGEPHRTFAGFPQGSSASPTPTPFSPSPRSLPAGSAVRLPPLPGNSAGVPGAFLASDDVTARDAAAAGAWRAVDEMVTPGVAFHRVNCAAAVVALVVALAWWGATSSGLEAEYPAVPGATARRAAHWLRISQACLVFGLSLVKGTLMSFGGGRPGNADAVEVGLGHVAVAVGAAAARGWTAAGRGVGDGDRAMAVVFAARTLFAGAHRVKAATSSAASLAALRGRDKEGTVRALLCRTRKKRRSGQWAAAVMHGCGDILAAAAVAAALLFEALAR